MSTYQALQLRAEELEACMNRKGECLPWVPPEFDGIVRPWHVVESLLRKELLKRNRATAYRARKREANATAKKTVRTQEPTQEQSGSEREGLKHEWL